MGVQTREVVCVNQLLKYFRITEESNCKEPKPILIQDCKGPPCGSSWYMSDFSGV